MSTLLSFGELLMDMLVQGDGTFRPFPGGAPANVAVGFARLGGRAFFAGGIATDAFGRQLSQSLRSCGVETAYLKPVENAQTALAFVHLDEQGERSFTFYRHDTADVRVTNAHFDDIDWQGTDIFHFCSNTLTDDRIADVTRTLAGKAKRHGLLVSFDVNLRPLLWPDARLLADAVDVCLALADVVKLSSDELSFLAGHQGLTPNDYLTMVFSKGVKVILLSDGSKPTRTLTPHAEVNLNAPIITAVDTTAAGDAMMAGFLFGLSQNAEDSNRALHSLLGDISALTEATRLALKCGALACTRRGAFASMPTLDEIRKAF